MPPATDGIATAAARDTATASATTTASDTAATESQPPTLAVWKFASCDGCQPALPDCENELLAVAGRVRIAHFREATGVFGSTRQARTEAMARLLLSDGAASDQLLRALTSANPADPADPAFRAIGPAVAHGAAGDEAGRARDEERREP